MKNVKPVYKTTEHKTEGKPYSIFVYSDGSTIDSRVKGKGRPSNTNGQGILTEIKKFLHVKAPKVKAEKKVRVSTKTTTLTEHLNGPKQTLLHYSNGTDLIITVAGRGQPKKIHNGLPLVKVVKYSPEAGTAVKAEVERITLTGPEAFSEFTYADGTVLNNKGKAGAPKKMLNGSPLVKVVKYTAEKGAEKKARKATSKAKAQAAAKTLAPVSLDDVKPGMTLTHVSKVNVEDNFVQNVKVVEVRLGRVFAEFMLDGKLVTGPVKLEALRA